MRFEAFFLPASPGQRFCLFHPPAGASGTRGAIVYIHPFAEELNRTRRMAALQARAFAEAGYAVLQIDLFGCGDSSGEFGEATWAHWLDDVVLACDWLRQRVSAPLWLWGLRAGCLLACAATARLTEPCRLLLWQPVGSGKLALQQFLRLKIAGQLLDGKDRGSTTTLRQTLVDGQALEVAGYLVSPGLADGLEQAELAPASHVSRIEWLELSSAGDRQAADLSPAASATLSRWQAQGLTVRGTAVSGPAFWQTAEIEECPALIEATLGVLNESLPA